MFRGSMNSIGRGRVSQLLPAVKSCTKPLRPNSAVARSELLLRFLPYINPIVIKVALTVESRKTIMQQTAVGHADHRPGRGLM